MKLCQKKWNYVQKNEIMSKKVKFLCQKKLTENFEDSLSSRAAEGFLKMWTLVQFALQKCGLNRFLIIEFKVKNIDSSFTHA